MDTVDEARFGARKVLDQRVHDRTVIILGANAFVDMEDVALHKKTDGEPLAHRVQQIQQAQSTPFGVSHNIARGGMCLLVLLLLYFILVVATMLL